MPSTTRLMGSISALALTVTLLWAPRARAWFYPEHTVITEVAWQALPGWAREAIGQAIHSAREEGADLCDEGAERALTPFWDALACARAASWATSASCEAEPVECIPYGALPALAGDHSPATGVLEREVLTQLEGEDMPIGRRINLLSFELWHDSLEDFGLREQLANAGYFGDALARRLNQYYGVFDRGEFVRGLDVELFSLDPNYLETAIQARRTHFQLAGTPLNDVIVGLFYGDLDNAMAQFLAHHIQSLRLAKRGRETGSSRDLTDALLHHAFALHFLEDAYSAGHMVVPDDPFFDTDAIRKQRHDHYNRRGLITSYALAAGACELFEYEQPVIATDLDSWRSCWTTYGDGFLGLDNSWQDLMHASEGVARAQIQFAVALDPTWLEGVLESCPDPLAAAEGDPEAEEDLLFAAARLDPNPPWIELEAGPVSPLIDRACSVLAGTRMALEAMGTEASRPLNAERMDVEVEPVPAAVIDLVEPLVPTIFEPCLPRDEISDKYVIDPDSEAVCGAGRAVPLGPPLVSLLRPMLVAWPVSRVDVRTLPGRDPFRHGFGYQLLTGPFTSARWQSTNGADFTGSTGGGLFSFGFAYITDSVLPGLAVRPAIDVSFGITTGVAFNPGAVQTQLFIEPRWQIIWDYVKMKLGWHADWLNLAEGMRFYWVDTGPNLEYLGWDLEVYSYQFASSDPDRSATDSLPPPTTFRFRVGNQRTGVDPLLPRGGVTFSLEFLVGLRNFF